MLDDQEGDSESEQIQNLTWNEGKEEREWRQSADFLCVFYHLRLCINLNVTQPELKEELWKYNQSVYVLTLTYNGHELRVVTERMRFTLTLRFSDTYLINI